MISMTMRISQAEVNSLPLSQIRNFLISFQHQWDVDFDATWGSHDGTQWRLTEMRRSHQYFAVRAMWNTWAPIEYKWEHTQIGVNSQSAYRNNCFKSLVVLLISRHDELQSNQLRGLFFFLNNRDVIFPEEVLSERPAPPTGRALRFDMM